VSRPTGDAELYQRLRAHLAFLKMPDAAEALPGLLDQARDQQVSVLAALEALLAIETEAVESRRQTGRLRFASLPEPWTLDQFDFSAQPGVDEALVRDLATLRFLDDASNVLLIGPPGVGKTMLAVCLARAAVDAGHRVYFTSAADLAARCRKASLEGRWNTVMRFFAGPKLLVIDELGYLDVPEEAVAALFQVITQRHSKVPSCSPRTSGWRRGPRNSGTRWSPRPCSTGCCNAPSCWASTDRPTGCAPIRPAAPTWRER